MWLRASARLTSVLVGMAVVSACGTAPATTAPQQGPSAKTFQTKFTAIPLNLGLGTYPLGYGGLACGLGGFGLGGYGLGGGFGLGYGLGAYGAGCGLGVASFNCGFGGLGTYGAGLYGAGNPFNYGLWGGMGNYTLGFAGINNYAALGSLGYGGLGLGAFTAGPLRTPAIGTNIHAGIAGPQAMPDQGLIDQGQVDVPADLDMQAQPQGENQGKEDVKSQPTG